MLEVCMKRDGRTMDHRTLEEIRKMAVERVREGERPSAVIASYGFHRCVIYRWLKQARGRGKGLKALTARASGVDGAKAVAAGLSTRSAGHRALAARDLPGPGPPGQAPRGGYPFLGGVGR